MEAAELGNSHVTFIMLFLVIRFCLFLTHFAQGRKVDLGDHDNVGDMYFGRQALMF
jgi:hypothetical protein